LDTGKYHKKYPTLVPSSLDYKGVEGCLYGSGKPGLLTFNAPVTLAAELSTFVVGLGEMSEDTFLVVRSQCKRLVGLLGGPTFTPRDELLCVLWFPILVWDAIFPHFHITNPYNKLPFDVNDLDFTKLSFIDHSRYKLVSNHLFTRGVQSFNLPVFKEKRSMAKYVKNFFKKCILHFNKFTFAGEHSVHDLEMYKRLCAGFSKHKFFTDSQTAAYRFSQPKIDLRTIGLHITKTQINGNNGSATNTDDHSPSKFAYDICDIKHYVIKDKAGFKYPIANGVKATSGKQEAYFGTHQYRPVCYANTKENEEATLRARVVVATPKPNEKFMCDFITFVKKNILEILNYKVIKISPVSDAAYLERSNASPGVKRVLVKTYAWLKENNIDCWSKLPKNLVRKWVSRSLFLKKENLNYRTPYGVKVKAGRAIQGAPPEFICLVGPWIMALQDFFKGVWSKDNWLCFACGVSAWDAAGLLNAMWQVVEDDISTFDSSVSPELCKLEVDIATIFGIPNAVLLLLRANQNTHGYTFHGAEYHLPGARKSGDPYTTLFNSILNALMHIYIVHVALGWSIKEIKRKCRMLVAGDDNALTIDTEVRIDFRHYMERLGFKSEAIFRTIHTLEFCSCRVYYVDGRPCFGPMPGKVLSKLGFLNSPPTDVTVESMLKGIALGLRQTCYYIPPIRIVVDRLLVLCGDAIPFHKKEFSKQEEWQMNFTSLYVPKFEPDVMCSLQNTYGWNVAMQKQFEKYFSSYTIGQKISCPSFNVLCDIDTAGPSVLAA